MTTRRSSFTESAGAVITPSGRWWRFQCPAEMAPCQGGVAGLAAVRVLERCLRAVLDPELREQMQHVELHRVVGEAEALGDLRVGESVRDEGPHFALARGQLTRRAPSSPRAAVDPASRGLWG